MTVKVVQRTEVFSSFQVTFHIIMLVDSFYAWIGALPEGAPAFLPNGRPVANMDNLSVAMMTPYVS
jgi:hypothetical protein